MDRRGAQDITINVGGVPVNANPEVEGNANRPYVPTGATVYPNNAPPNPYYYPYAVPPPPPPNPYNYPYVVPPNPYGPPVYPQAYQQPIPAPVPAPAPAATAQQNNNNNSEYVPKANPQIPNGNNNNNNAQVVDQLRTERKIQNAQNNSSGGSDGIQRAQMPLQNIDLIPITGTVPYSVPITSGVTPSVESFPFLGTDLTSTTTKGGSIWPWVLLSALIAALVLGLIGAIIYHNSLKKNPALGVTNSTATNNTANNNTASNTSGSNSGSTFVPSGVQSQQNSFVQAPSEFPLTAPPPLVAPSANQVGSISQQQQQQQQPFLQNNNNNGGVTTQGQMLQSNNPTQQGSLLQNAPPSTGLVIPQARGIQQQSQQQQQFLAPTSIQNQFIPQTQMISGPNQQPQIQQQQQQQYHHANQTLGATLPSTTTQNQNFAAPSLGTLCPCNASK